MCFVMVGDSTIQSASNTVAAGPEVTQSLEKGLRLSSFVSAFAWATSTSTGLAAFSDLNQQLIIFL